MSCAYDRPLPPPCGSTTPSTTLSWSLATPSLVAAAAVSASRAVAQAWRICMPPFWIERLPNVMPWSGVSSVSPWITSTRAIGTESSSAAICASAVRKPVPRSTLPE